MRYVVSTRRQNTWTKQRETLLWGWERWGRCCGKLITYLHSYCVHIIILCCRMQRDTVSRQPWKFNIKFAETKQKRLWAISVSGRMAVCQAIKLLTQRGKQSKAFQLNLKMWKRHVRKIDGWQSDNRNRATTTTTINKI